MSALMEAALGVWGIRPGGLLRFGLGGKSAGESEKMVIFLTALDSHAAVRPGGAV